MEVNKSIYDAFLIDRLKEHLARRSVEVAEADARASVLEDGLNQAIEQLSNAQAEIDEIKKHNNTIFEDLQKANKNLDDFQEQYEKLLKEYEELKSVHSLPVIEASSINFTQEEPPAAVPDEITSLKDFSEEE